MKALCSWIKSLFKKKVRPSLRTEAWKDIWPELVKKEVGMDKPESFVLPAGTLCKRNGIPFVLLNDTGILCHPGNFSLIAGEWPSTDVGLTAAEIAARAQPLLGVEASSAPNAYAATSTESAFWETATGQPFASPQADRP